MKILMTKSWTAPEYLDDCVLHGLRSLFGTDVVEYPRMWHMYANEFGTGKQELTSIAARGFTLYGMLDDTKVDRTDLKDKIRLGYFDLIIMHSWYPSELYPIISQYTPSSKLVWLDGRDEQLILTPYVGYGHYFKRELATNESNVRPISFAIPIEKLRKPVEKIQPVAHCVAGDTSTYIYNTEDLYYHQYNEALLGVTMKKQGWDCLRHYEILASNCVPWFLNIEQCPQTTCTTLPKQELMQVNQLIDRYGVEALMYGQPRNQYNDIAEAIRNHFVKYCTTTVLAKYILDSVLR